MLLLIILIRSVFLCFFLLWFQIRSLVLIKNIYTHRHIYICVSIYVYIYVCIFLVVFQVSWHNNHSFETSLCCFFKINMKQWHLGLSFFWQHKSPRNVFHLILFSRLSWVTDFLALPLRFEKSPLPNRIPHIILNLFYTITAQLVILPGHWTCPVTGIFQRP